MRSIILYKERVKWDTSLQEWVYYANPGSIWGTVFTCVPAVPNNPNMDLDSLILDQLVRNYGTRHRAPIYSDWYFKNTPGFTWKLNLTAIYS